MCAAVLVQVCCGVCAGVAHAADFLSLCVMVHLLWPSRSYLVFNLKQQQLRTDIQMDGLDSLAGTATLFLLESHISLSLAC